MSKDPIDVLLVKELYGKPLSGVGVKYDETIYVKDYRKVTPLSNSSTLQDLNLIPEVVIPDQTYHPDVKVCIDFTHVFTQNLTEEEAKNAGLASNNTRIISKDLLIAIVKEVAYKYYTYYDDTVLQYIEDIQGTSYINDKITAILNDENEMCVFLNDFINLFITNINITRQINNIGTMTLTLKESYYEDCGIKFGTLLNPIREMLYQLLLPCLPITVYARGRIYKDYYFAIFDGFITQIAPKDNQGYIDIDLICKDILEFARISQEMINPSLLQFGELKEQNSINIFSIPLYGIGHTVIFKTLFNGGNVTLRDDNTDFILVNKEKTPPGERVGPAKSQNGIGFSGLGYEFIDAGYDPSYPSTMKEVITNNVFDAKYIKQKEFSTKKQLSKTGYGNKQYARGRALVYWGQDTTPYRIFGTQAVKAFSSDFESRLSVLTKLSELLYYNFYVDGAGNINFHPMRVANTFFKTLAYDPYSTDFIDIKNPFPHAQTVGLEETLADTSLLNTDELVTYFVLCGMDPLGVTQRSEALVQSIKAGVVDKEFLPRFGYRRAEEQNQMFNYNDILKDSQGKKFEYFKMAATELIKYKNASLYTRTANIVFRPEMELASPVYFADTEEVFYIRGLTHTITIGGEAITTVDGYLGRKATKKPTDLYSYTVYNEIRYKSKPTAADIKILENDLLANFKIQEATYYAPFIEKEEKIAAQENKAEELALLDTNTSKIADELAKAMEAQGLSDNQYSSKQNAQKDKQTKQLQTNKGEQ